MTRPATFLLVAVVCYLGASLPPAASSPTLLKPEGSYTPEQETTIRLLDKLLNQLLHQVAVSHGKDPRPFSDEDGSSDAEAEVRPLPPRPTFVSPARPQRPGDSGEVGSSGGSETHPGIQPVNNGHIVFPSNQEKISPRGSRT